MVRIIRTKKSRKTKTRPDRDMNNRKNAVHNHEINGRYGQGLEENVQRLKPKYT